MENRSYVKILSGKEALIFLVTLILGTCYIGFIRNNTIEQEKEKALLVARSVAASFSMDNFDSIPKNIQDIQSSIYLQLKSTLKQVIAENKEARFAYIYIQRNSKLYFLVDSEPESSNDFSPSGEEFTEADQIDAVPFQTGKAQITPPITDRWGTWVSAEVPIKDASCKVLAIFGMDYNAKSWKYHIWGATTESSLLVILVILLIVAFILNTRKNKKLQEEITLRKKIEQEIREKETDYRLLFEFNPTPILVIELNTGNILAVNHATTKKYGYSESEFIKMTVNDLESQNVPNHQETIEPCLFFHGEIAKHRLKNGETIKVKVHSQNFQYNRKNAKLLLLIDITDNLKTEKELLEKQIQLSNLLSNLPGIVYRCNFDEIYTMKFISEGCTRITGYSPEQFILGKSISFNDLILPEYRKSIHEKWEESILQNSYFEDTYPIQTVSGETKWLWQRGRGVYEADGKTLHLEGYIEDVTDKKLAEQQLKKLSRAVEQNPVSIVITDAIGNIEYVNPRFTEMTGYDANEAIGQNPRILKSGKMDSTFYKELWATIKTGAIWNGEIINKRKTGEFYWANKTISAIFDKKGNISNYVALGEDITERKRIEEELIKAKEKAEESDRLKSSFLANISHEIRTPMNGILGFADLLKSPDLSSEHQIEFIEIIEKSGQRMLSIINDLIDISKIEAGETAIRIKSVDINLMLSDIHSFFLPETNQKNIRLDFLTGLTEEGATMKTDGIKLNQILTNLIKNAIKFTDKGTITFGYQQVNSMVEFFVTDTGPGIPPDQMELIFERFRQSSLNLTRKYEGAGLGLSISKAYVEMLGGTIEVESEWGKGSKFRFKLPLNYDEKEAMKK